MIHLNDFNKQDRSLLAQLHHNYVSEKFKGEIAQSIENSHVYSVPYSVSLEVQDAMADIISEHRGLYPDQKLFLVPMDTVSCLFRYQDSFTNGITVLNFASFKHPGGMFLNGSPAQEESLCHQSTLHNVLLAFVDNYYAPHLKALDRGLYQDDAIYSKDVLFFDKTIEKTENGVSIKTNRTVKADVITCAAPNATTFLRRKYGISHMDEYLDTDCELHNALCGRILTVLNTAVLYGATNLILGAFGCGVFGNNPVTVADYFYDYLTDDYKGCFKNIYFAVPNPRGTDKNYKAFKDLTSTYGVICLEGDD